MGGDVLRHELEDIEPMTELLEVRNASTMHTAMISTRGAVIRGNLVTGIIRSWAGDHTPAGFQAASSAASSNASASPTR